MFTELITEKNKDPLGAMLVDYLHGKRNISLDVESPDLEIWTMNGTTMFREHDEMSALEKMALSRCIGRVLDVGAGSGCHSLILQEQGLAVDAIDISLGCVEVMNLRGVRSCHHTSLFSLREEQYDTILMLMNGLGICGSLDGCNLFLQLIGMLLADGGQVLADSTDFTHSFDLASNDFWGDYPGETEFVMKYEGRKSDPFRWLYIDYATLQTLAEVHELHCQRIYTEDDGRYLARIWQA